MRMRELKKLKKQQRMGGPAPEEGTKPKELHLEQQIPALMFCCATPDISGSTLPVRPIC